MNIPDKIYLAKSLSFPDKIHRQWYKEDVVGNGIEYIRKDTLLEILNKIKDDDGKSGVTSYAYKFAIMDVIDKLNEL